MNTVLEIKVEKTELVMSATSGEQTVLEINETPQVEILTVGIQGPAGRDGAETINSDLVVWFENKLL